MLPPPILLLLQSAFPGQTIAEIAPAYGGFSNLSVTATIGGEPWVIKAAERPLKRADLRREAAVLRALGQRGRGAGKSSRAAAIYPPPPTLLESDRPAPGRAEDTGQGGSQAGPELHSLAGWTVLVQRRLPGEPGLRLYAGPPEALAPALAALGRALAELHQRSVPLSASGPLPTIAERAAETAAALAGMPLEAGLREALRDALGHPVWAEGGAHIAHGDAGLHNILWGGGRATLIDWELAGRGSPLIDLGWAAWTVGFRRLPGALWGALRAGYGAGPELTPEALRAVALGQIAGLLWRAHGQPAAWDEWLRRLRWTIADTPDLGR